MMKSFAQASKKKSVCVRLPCRKKCVRWKRRAGMRRTSVEENAIEVDGKKYDKWNYEYA